MMLVEIGQLKRPSFYIPELPFFYSIFGRLIVEAIEDKNPRNDEGWTPLHGAVSHGHFDICELILKNVRETNPSADNGRSPLHLAAKLGNLKIFKLF